MVRPPKPGRPAVAVPTASNCHGDFGRHFACGTHPDGSSVDVVTLQGVTAHKAQLLNDTREQLRTMLHASGTFGGLSLTSNLLKVRFRMGGAASSGGGGEGEGSGGGAGGGGGCEAYLGVGHLHRGEGERNRRLYRRKPDGPLPWQGTSAGLKRKQPFTFGFRYTHFWYVLEPRPPFGLLAASPEFCLGSHQDAADCESVQFISGLGLAPAPAVRAHVPSANRTRRDASEPRLMLAYGVNDCEARLGFLPLARVWDELRPLTPGGRRCG